jgi:hypothetical protein
MSGCGCTKNQKGGGSKRCSCKKCRRYVQRGGWSWSSLFTSSQDTTQLNSVPDSYTELNQLNQLNPGVVTQQGGKRKTRKTRKTRRVKKSRKYRR